MKTHTCISPISSKSNLKTNIQLFLKTDMNLKEPKIP